MGNALALSIMSMARALARAADLWTTLWLAQVNRRAYAGSSGSLRTAMERVERAAYRSGFSGQFAERIEPLEQKQLF
jgi:hypothetical protein